jgi:hypothetical protein
MPAARPAGTVYAATLVRGGPPGMALGTGVVLKFDADVDAEEEAAPEALPHFRDGSTPLSSLPAGGVLREAHAYAALLGGAGVVAPPAAPVPSWCLPFTCEQLTWSTLAQKGDGCAAAVTARRVYGLVLPRLGRSLYAISRDEKKPLSQQDALAMGAWRAHEGKRARARGARAALSRDAAATAAGSSFAPRAHCPPGAPPLPPRRPARTRQAPR